VIQYLLIVFTLGTITAILSLGLNVRWGWSGDLDLAYYACVAFGAYVAGVITLPRPSPFVGTYILGLSLPFVVGLGAAMVASGLLSLAIGALALRNLRSDYLAIVTLATFSILYSWVNQYSPLFNGPVGIFGIPQPFSAVLNFDPDTYAVFFFALCLAFLILVYAVLDVIYRSPFGRLMRAIREEETAVAAFGRDVYRNKLKAYVLGGVVGGLGGALLAHFIGSFSPAGWDVTETILLYAAIFVGGSANHRGVILGTFIVPIFFLEVTRLLGSIPGHPDAWPALRAMAIGLLILAFLRWRPRGLLPEPRQLDKTRGAVNAPPAPPSTGSLPQAGVS
jgi:branched-chain amino acid transport system permease protein